MASIIKIADIVGIKETLLNFYKALRNFLATKTEMDVVATALTDLDQRIDEAMPTIEIGTVTTVDAGKKAQVVNSGTNTKVVLDFSIPRGEQGDMKELDDKGSDHCEVVQSWVYNNPNLSATFADMIQVPVPSVEAMVMDADCIKQTNPLTLNVGESNFKSDHEWKDLHWLLQCSNTDRIVYTTKYATPDASFQSVDGAISNSPPAIIEISVSYNKTQNFRYVQVTVENMYGRAYYIQKQ